MHNAGDIADYELRVLLPDTGDGRVTYAVAVEVAK